MLYATVGDAQNTGAAQDPTSLSGKILRMGLDGSVPADNPFPGSLVYNLGHRNPQGIAWDRDGQLWAAEFGQNTWDEFNIINAGANYGWPVVEGIGSDPAFVNPVYQWPTDAAGTTALDFYTGQFGRIRDVVAGPAGSLWILTNKTGRRGNPAEGDDRILQVTLVPRSAG